MSETTAAETAGAVPVVAPPKRRRTGLVIGLIAVVLVLVGGGIAAYALLRDDEIKIGVVGASDPYWAVYTQIAADAGIKIKIIDFSEYPLPNPALTEGEIDINQFQHIVYLGDYIAKSGHELTPLGSTAIYPLGLYSKTYDSAQAIPDGSTVVVPDDPSNQARALLVLQSAGLIELKDGGSIFSTLADVDKTKSRVEVKAVAAAFTPTSLDDAAAAIINNDFVEKAGLSFADAIAKDDPSDASALPYVNIFAVRPEDKDNPTYIKLIELFQDSKAVTDGLQAVSGGVATLAKVPQAELQAALDKVVADTKAQG
ncbi:MAG: methionine ABC transporter substrate-binding protein [Propionibacteriaceae bacterium]|jgi:D-methionine transport system substrate-binding protein|nr:methionine ABC transporter substrate-binding protein [Propionibacteriaceae bacterium]